MRNEVPHKKIKLREDLNITIFPLTKHSILYELDAAEAEQFGEASIQILESKRYEYELSNKLYQLESIGDICFPSYSDKTSRGTITPGNYVGTLELSIIKEGENKIPLYLEVLATKFDSENDFDKSYRTNYRSMIEDITEKCTELLMQANSPVNQYFEPDFERENNTVYQRFSFVKSILNNSEFDESIQKIISSPKTNWVNKEEVVDIRSIKRFTNQNVKDLLKVNNRIKLLPTHPLYSKDRIESVPTKINSYKQEASIDNPENRFIKHSLQTYLQFCKNCEATFKTNSKDHKEAISIVNKLEELLNHSFFKEVSRPTTLKLNSPSLQRKSGYREQLKNWLMFDLASRLTWSGGEDVYESGKRDIATLYEYWLFFVLYDLFKEKFELDHIEHNDEPYNHLFETTLNGINLIIKSGQHTALSGASLIKNRKINVKFSFNRTFSGNNYPKSGSWTTAMRPDYTLSVWPTGLKEYKNDNGEKEAEIKEQIVHIHFDAKYKVDNFIIKRSQNDIEENEIQDHLDKIKKEERSGKFKNADLLKMHSYKDAIRRTGGAYILYPGTEETRFKGFHELIPGLGAFSLNPANQNDDISKLSKFINEVIEHLVDRTSQRENIADKTYKIIKESKDKVLHEPIPEYIKGEKLIPDETFILVGFYKDKNHLDWIVSKKLYNFRIGSGNGSLVLDKETITAKYLLLHTHKDKNSSKLWRVISKGPKVYSKANLIKKGYYSTSEEEYYLVIDLEEVDDIEFKGNTWKFKELQNYKEGRASSAPFTVSLTELMSAKVKENMIKKAQPNKKIDELTYGSLFDNLSE